MNSVSLKRRLNAEVTGRAGGKHCYKTNEGGTVESDWVLGWFMVTTLICMQLYRPSWSTGMTLFHTLIYVLVFPCVLLSSPLHLPLTPPSSRTSFDLWPFQFSSPLSELKGFYFFFHCLFFMFIFSFPNPGPLTAPLPYPHPLLLPISTASVINNASQCIKNISRFSSLSEREEGEERLTQF